MPRKTRLPSATQIYHVILRGINQQILFEDDADYTTFLTLLRESEEQDHFLLHAYCLMDNHVHLLIQEKDVPLSIFMSRLEIRYAKWYNHKYNRSGYLFQDRYKSSPVNNEQYLLTVFRYIHQNPYHAWIEREIGTYPWSSFNEYRYEDEKLVTRELICSYFDSQEDLLDYLRTPVTEQHMEYYSSKRIPDREVINLIREISDCSGPGEFQRLDLQARDAYIKVLLKNDISVRQLSRLTGTGKTVIERIKKTI